LAEKTSSRPQNRRHLIIADIARHLKKTDAHHWFIRIALMKTTKQGLRPAGDPPVELGFDVCFQQNIR
jgi:hypothetical protein